jgi:AMP-binding enzyme
VELEISAIEAGLRTPHTDGPQRAVTEHILALADQVGCEAALIDAVAQGHTAAAEITWPQFAHMVRAAAHGLSRRGLGEADTAGIFVGDAVSHAVAVHAVRAAGAIAAPVRPAQSAADIAAELKERRVRLLITSAGLAEVAIEAAERSWVRQVYAFGEAEGTTPFGSLLETPRPANGSSSHNGTNSHSGSSSHNGSYGHSGLAAVEQASELPGLAPDRAVPQLIRRPVPRLTYKDVVLATPPCGDPDAYTSLLDLALAAGATIVAVPLAQVTTALGVYRGTAAIVPRGTEVPGLPAGRVLAVG